MNSSAATLIALCIVLVSAGFGTGARLPRTELKELKINAAQFISEMFVSRLVASSNKSPRDPVLPEFPAVVPVNGTYDFAELGSDVISGTVSLSEGEITGLDTAVDDLSIFFTIPAGIKYRLDAGQVGITGPYTADVLIESGYRIPVTGRGDLVADINKPSLFVDGALLINLITNRATLTRLSIDVSFESLNVQAEQFTICGTEIDWAQFNEEIKTDFDELYAEIKPDLEQIGKDLVNDLLKNCPLTQLVAGDFSCLVPSPDARSQRVSSHSFMTSFAKYVVTHRLPEIECEELPAPEP